MSQFCQLVAFGGGPIWEPTPSRHQGLPHRPSWPPWRQPKAESDSSWSQQLSEHWKVTQVKRQKTVLFDVLLVKKAGRFTTKKFPNVRLDAGLMPFCWKTLWHPNHQILVQPLVRHLWATANGHQATTDKAQPDPNSLQLPAGRNCLGPEGPENSILNTNDDIVTRKWKCSSKFKNGNYHQFSYIISNIQILDSNFSLSPTILHLNFYPCFSRLISCRPMSSGAMARGWFPSRPSPWQAAWRWSKSEQVTRPRRGRIKSLDLWINQQ